MRFFVPEDSIVRKIWSRSDTIIFIFAGSAAEFALNKAVDWLYYTGKLPADPIGRLFSTVAYARQIVFSEYDAALQAIDKITGIHAAVEASRQQKIPEWAYRDVLFMLIHYSIASYEVLERKLSAPEKEDVFDVFHRMAARMDLKGLPENFEEWEIMRADHLQHNLHKGDFTIDLFKQYKLHLGSFRYHLLLQGQILVVPPIVNQLLHLGKFSWLRLVLPPYKICRLIGLEWVVKSLVLPKNYKKQIKDLDRAPK